MNRLKDQGQEGSASSCRDVADESGEDNHLKFVMAREARIICADALAAFHEKANDRRMIDP